MSRIGPAFRRAKEEGRPALIGYLMAGDPKLASSEAFALACERGGADVLEFGIPFSDPIADGPEIQRAGQRALQAGARPRDVLDLVARLRPKMEIPIVLMTYMNPIEAMGLEGFASACATAGVDGVIVPDLSLEESDGIREALDTRGIDHIQLVAPSTPEDRARAIGQASRGFLYVIARYGTTGTRARLPDELAARLKVLRRASTLPLAVGFGVSTKDHVRTLVGMGVDGIVVGSAIVRQTTEDARPEAVEAFVRELATGLRLV